MACEPNSDIAKETAFKIFEIIALMKGFVVLHDKHYDSECPDITKLTIG